MREAIVFGRDGLRGYLVDALPSDGDELVRVELEGNSVLELPAGLLKRRSDNSFDMPFGPADIEDMRASAGAPSARSGPNDSETTTKVPVIAEELDVKTRAVSTGAVRVHRRVLEHEELIDMPLLKESLDVRRVVVDREVDGPMPVRKEGETTVIPLVEEVLVVQKKYILREEVHVSKTVHEERHRETVTVRRQEADIEKVDSEGNRRRVEETPREAEAASTAKRSSEAAAPRSPITGKPRRSILTDR
jgi:uncharacterized protein (TIGR02271 family)